MLSKQNSLNKKDVSEWVRNTKMFLAPLGILYLTQVIGTLGVSGHIFSLVDLIPNQLTQGGMVLYVMNVALDILLKWREGK